MTVRSTEGASPTDLELMLYADGELDGARRAAVETWLASRDEGARAARSKLAALGLVSSLVRERAEQAGAAAPSVADAVMARVKTDAPVRKATPPKGPPPANDTSPARYLVAVALVAAAAAGAILWTRAAPPPEAPLQAGAVTSPAGSEHDPAGDGAHGVQVSAVDFGGRPGAVYYVPTGTSASSTTALVWLADDCAPEDDE